MGIVRVRVHLRCLVLVSFSSRRQNCFLGIYFCMTDQCFFLCPIVLFSAEIIEGNFLI